MLKPLNEGTHEEMCVCTGIFGFLWGFPISDRIRELQLLHTMEKKKKKINFYCVEAFLRFLMLLLKSKTSTSATHWIIPTQNHSKGEAKISRRSIIPIWIVVWRAGYQTWSREGEAGGCDVRLRDAGKGLANSTVQDLLSCLLLLSENSFGKGQQKLKKQN